MGMKPKRKEFEARIFPWPREAPLLCDLLYGLKTVSKEMHVRLHPQNVNLLGNRVFADLISYDEVIEVWVGAKFNMTNVLVRGEDTGKTHKVEYRVKIEAEIKAVCLSARNIKGLPETVRI